MDKRRKQVAESALRRERVELYAAIDAGTISIAQAARRMRKLSMLTQAEFARHRGVSTRVIMEIERGTGNPTVKTLNQIAAIFGLEVGFVRRQRPAQDPVESPLPP